MCASQKSKSGTMTKEDREGQFDSRAFARCRILRRFFCRLMSLCQRQASAAYDIATDKRNASHGPEDVDVLKERPTSNSRRTQAR